MNPDEFVSTVKSLKSRGLTLEDISILSRRYVSPTLVGRVCRGESVITPRTSKMIAAIKPITEEAIQERINRPKHTGWKSMFNIKSTRAGGKL